MQNSQWFLPREKSQTDRDPASGWELIGQVFLPDYCCCCCCRCRLLLSPVASLHPEYIIPEEHTTPCSLQSIAFSFTCTSNNSRQEVSEKTHLRKPSQSSSFSLCWINYCLHLFVLLSAVKEFRHCPDHRQVLFPTSFFGLCITTFVMTSFSTTRCFQSRWVPHSQNICLTCVSIGEFREQFILESVNRYVPLPFLEVYCVTLQPKVYQWIPMSCRKTVSKEGKYEKEEHASSSLFIDYVLSPPFSSIFFFQKTLHFCVSLSFYWSLILKFKQPAFLLHSSLESCIKSFWFFVWQKEKDCLYPFLWNMNVSSLFPVSTLWSKQNQPKAFSRDFKEMFCPRLV